MKEQQEIFGKKIVFVHPPELVKQHIMEILSENEYEAYILKNHEKVSFIANSYPETLFFINLDAGLSESEWEVFILKVKKDISALQLGLLSFNISSPDQIQHYILDVGVSCGFIQLKQGAKVAEEMMLKILHANEAKGRRKYIRYICRESDHVSLNMKIGDAAIQGSIQDISSIGMACQLLSSEVSLVKNQMVKDIQMRLRGAIISTGGVVLGLRDMPDGSVKYVILFTGDKTDKTKQKIRSFIHHSYQKRFDEEFQLN